MNIDEYKIFLKQNKIVLILLMMSVVVLIGSSYAWYSLSFISEKEQSIASGELSLNLEGETNEISLANAIPLSDQEGMDQEGYHFSVTNKGTLASKYSIQMQGATIGDENRMSETFVKYNLVKNNYNRGVGLVSELKNVESKKLLAEGTIGAGETINFTLKFWIIEEATTEISGQEFRTNLIVKGEQLKGIPNEPELVGEMIPVIYDDTKATWKKADYTQNDWYNYDEQRWANAVTIKDSRKRNDYQNANIGTEIKMEDINTFMVWIPRYSYTIGNDRKGYLIEGAESPSLDYPGAFNIKFVSKNKTDKGSGKYTGSLAEGYYTPSSFCFGDTCDDDATRSDAGNKELNGIWVAKFEMSGQTDTINGGITEITDLPNVTSLREEGVSSMFTSIQNLMNGNKAETNYGLKGNYDTHMIKSTEWGAFTYLTQSKYGKYGNEKYSGIDREVSVNNCTNYITGIGGDTVNARGEEAVCTKNTYQTALGQAASTTGNIYGIYDAAGGAHEYVMGNYNNQEGLSGFTKTGSTLTNLNRRYYNLYTGPTSIKADATAMDFGFPLSESLSYYYDYVESEFLTVDTPWMSRGGNAQGGGGVGIFYHGMSNGIGFEAGSSRFVLVNY